MGKLNYKNHFHKNRIFHKTRLQGISLILRICVDETNHWTAQDLVRSDFKRK